MGVIIAGEMGRSRQRLRAFGSPQGGCDRVERLQGVRNMFTCNALRESHHSQGRQSSRFCPHCYDTRRGRSGLLWRIRRPDSIFCSQQPFAHRCTYQELRTAIEHRLLWVCSSQEDLFRRQSLPPQKHAQNLYSKKLSYSLNAPSRCSLLHERKARRRGPATSFNSPRCAVHFGEPTRYPNRLHHVIKVCGNRSGSPGCSTLTYAVAVQ